MRGRGLGPGVWLVAVGSMVLMLGLAAWGWGGVRGLLGHPARVLGCVVVVVATIAALFTEMNLGGFERAEPWVRWAAVPLILFLVLFAWLPAYADRLNLWTLDGDAVRYLGVVLLAVGSVLRVGPIFVLGRRFTWPLAPQEPHKLMTTGFYRYIRHPSYLGALVGGIGWVLLFRSGVGLVLMLLLAVSLVRVIGAEEKRLAAEFGEAYTSYQKRTWRLIPFVY